MSPSIFVVFTCWHQDGTRLSKTDIKADRKKHPSPIDPNLSICTPSPSLMIFSSYISNKIQIAKTTAKIRGGKVTQNQDLHKRQRKGGYINFSFDIFKTSPPYSPYRGPGVIVCWHHNYKQHIGVSYQCVEPSCSSVEWVDLDFHPAQHCIFTQPLTQHHARFDSAEEKFSLNDSC